MVRSSFGTCPPGDYSLYLKPAEQEIAIRVTQGEDRDGFTFSPRRALERPRLASLEVAAVEVGADAVAIRLANATPFTRVHVFATRYLPAYDVFGRLGFTGAPAPLQQVWRSARTFYESGRDIGDEYRYILDRRLAKKFPGNMLDRPGLLLNPWAMRDTDTQGEVLAGGGAYGESPGGRRPGRQCGALRTESAPPEPPEGYASLDFLQQPAVVLWNLVPDKDGLLRIPLADLKGKPQLRILAVDPVTTLLKDVSLADTPVETRDLRLVAGLDPAKTYGEQKLITAVPAKGSLAIADATSARFETCDTIAKAYHLLATLGGNPTFEEFAFITTWPDLDQAEKQRRYSKYACHELSFFLYRKDPEFFQTVIAPYLKNKKDKTFMDRWLLGEDLTDYLEPWRFGRLNVAEQILLGKRLPAQQASVSRDVRERADLIPPDLEDFNRRFDTAVQTGALETPGGVTRSHRGTASETGRAREGRARRSGRPREGVADEPAGARRSSGQASGGAGAAERWLARVWLNRSGRRSGSREGRDRGKAGDSGLWPVAAARHEARRLPAKTRQATRKRSNCSLPRKPWDAAQARRFFQKLDQTKEWAENNYYHLPIEQQLADLVAVNEFWADYAEHDGPGPVPVRSFPQATRNFTEMMLALAVLDLPFKAGATRGEARGPPVHRASRLAAARVPPRNPRDHEGG